MSERSKFQSLQHERNGILRRKPQILSADGQSVKPLQLEKFSQIELIREARYLVKGMVPRIGLVVVWGPPKCGKSFLVLDLVAHVAAGRTYRGRRVEQCPVVYFAFEGHEGFRARIAALKSTTNWGDIPLHLCGNRLTLPSDVKALIDGINEALPTYPGIVVLDTVNRSIDGSENDPRDMGEYIRAADAIRDAFYCAVIVVHHCGIDPKRPRGHTSLTGAADAQISVKHVGGYVVSKVEFMKDGPEGAVTKSRLEPISLGKDDDNDPITSCVVRDAGEPFAGDHPAPSRLRLSKNNARIFQILKDTVGTERALEANALPAALESDWQSRCITALQNDGSTHTAAKKAFSRAIHFLANQGYIGRSEGKVWLL